VRFHGQKPNLKCVSHFGKKDYTLTKYCIDQLGFLNNPHLPTIIITIIIRQHRKEQNKEKQHVSIAFDRSCLN
jgi:hypothetical protein